MIHLEKVKIKTAIAILEKTSDTAEDYHDCMNGINTAINVLKDKDDISELTKHKSDRILGIITKFCNEDCILGSGEIECIEEDCKLWQIQQIVKE